MSSVVWNLTGADHRRNIQGLIHCDGTSSVLLQVIVFESPQFSFLNIVIVFNFVQPLGKIDIIIDE